MKNRPTICHLITLFIRQHGERKFPTNEATAKRHRGLLFERLQQRELMAVDVNTLNLELPYQIVDTAQTTSYGTGATVLASEPTSGDALFGQDSNYLGNQPSYTISDDGKTVIDNVTDLVWTHSIDWDGIEGIDARDQMTYAELETLVVQLNVDAYGGKTDWRIPTTKELYSLIQFDGIQPPPNGTSAVGAKFFLDGSVFNFAWGDTSRGDRIIDMQVWSSTEYVSTTMNNDRSFLSVNFADGRIKAYPYSSPGSQAPNDYYAMLVAGNPAYGQNDLSAIGDGTLMDAATGLMWTQQDSDIQMDWVEALAYVAQKNAENYLGYSDWRLPNAKELQSLVDYSKSPDTTGTPAISDLFDLRANEIKAQAYTGSAGDYGFHWTGTTFVEQFPNGELNSSAAVYISFFESLGLGNVNNTNVLDVHGAGAQRSDPKIASATFSRGDFFGPQLDLINIENYVLLVRTPLEPDAPTLQFETVSQTLYEETRTIAINAISLFAADRDISVPLIVSGSATQGNDFVIETTLLTFPAGATTASITIDLIDDSIEESSETIELTLGSPSVGTLGDQQLHTITIIDNDPANWHNEQNPYDVDKNGIVSPVDALAIINTINSSGVRLLDNAIDDHNRDIDVNNDGWVSPLDALQVINFLNRNGSGEGEPSQQTPFSLMPPTNKRLVNDINYFFEQYSDENRIR